MNIWREKFIAFLIHFVVTLVLAGAAAALIFLVWFPDPFQKMIGGSQLFLLVVGCDLALGPLISLVIYNSKKPRKELILDYTVVGLVQLAALIYGVYVVSSARPVYVAFVTDRIEVVTANEIDKAELAAAGPDYRALPHAGPKFVATQVPSAESHDAVLTALAGRDVSVRPRYYVPYDSQLETIKRKAQRLSDLEQRHPESVPLVAGVADEHQVEKDTLRWVPVKHRRGFWTALIDIGTGYPVGYIELDPY
jgi:hypothetical protein